MPTVAFIKAHGVKSIRFPDYYAEPRARINSLHRELLYRKGFHKNTHPDLYQKLIGWFPSPIRQAYHITPRKFT